MKKLLVVCLLVVMSSAAFAQTAPTAPASSGAAAQTVASVLERRLASAEKEFVDAADAMPEAKYGFAPTQGEFKGVRTFAEQVKHVAESNYTILAPVLGEKVPPPSGNENGPAGLKSKAEIMKYLRDSFAFAHRAVQSLNEQNLVSPIPSPFGQGSATRLGLVVLNIGHVFDHYGQVVVYLRSNGIVPPASRR